MFKCKNRWLEIWNNGETTGFALKARQERFQFIVMRGIGKILPISNTNRKPGGFRWYFYLALYRDWASPPIFSFKKFVLHDQSMKL